jgi:hypothetical protein
MRWNSFHNAFFFNMRYVILYSMLSPCNLIHWAQLLCHYGKHLDKSWHKMPQVILELPWYQISSTSMPTSVIREKDTQGTESLWNFWGPDKDFHDTASFHQSTDETQILKESVTCSHLVSDCSVTIKAWFLHLWLSCRWSWLCFYA